jgi:hypothetical protein
MADEYTETTTKGWGSRLMDSIKGVAIGGLLFLLSFPLLWWNEGRAVQTYKSLKEGRGAVVDVDAASVAPANENRLVHVSGLATTDETLADPQLGIQLQGIRLVRNVEMYQWVEQQKSEKKKKLGGGEETVTTYSYSKAWKSDVVDSSSFKRQENHENPGAMEFENASWQASKVTLGGFTLSDGLVGQIKSDEKLPMTEETYAQLPASLTGRAESTASAAPEEAPAPKAKVKGKAKGKHAKVAAAPRASRHATAAAATSGRLKLNGDGLYLGDSPSSPDIGDLKISYSKVMPAQVSVMARQAGSTLAGYQTKAGDVLEMLAAGTVGAAQMFAQAEAENAMLTWILRLVGFIMMFAGLMMVFKPIAVLGDVVPFIGTILSVGLGLAAFVVSLPLSLLTIALAWLFYRPLLGILLIAVAVGAVFGVKKLAANKKASAVPAAAAPAAPA